MKLGARGKDDREMVQSNKNGERIMRMYGVSTYEPAVVLLVARQPHCEPAQRHGALRWNGTRLYPLLCSTLAF